jgi:ketosteroid isomerase-like protein
MRNLVLLTLLGAAVACQDASSPGDDRAALSEASHRAHLDLREERASLIAAGNALSAIIQSQGVAPGLGGALADDALFLSPRSNVQVGRTATLSFLSAGGVAPSALRWDIIAADVSNDGSHGFTWGQGSFTIDLGAGPTELPGFFLTYWRRTSEGDWEVAVLSLNSGGPRTAPIPAGFGTPSSKHRRNFPNTEAAEEAAELLQVDAAFSAASVSDGTGPAFEQYAAPNAMAVGGGQFVFGPAAIGEAFTTGPNDVVSWVPRFADAAASGDLGFSVGDAVFVFAESGTFYTKYLSVWQKQNTGEWEFVADFGSSRPAP